MPSSSQRSPLCFRQCTGLFVSLLLAIITTGVSAATEKTGSISQVTVYRGQALVTRTIEAELPSGMSELIVTDLPPKIISETLYAQTSPGVNILSVRYREKAVREDTRQEVKELDAQVEALQTEIQQTEAHLKYNQDMWTMFTKLQDFSIQAANSDLNQGRLTFEPLKQLTDLIEQKGVTFRDSDLELKATLQQQHKDMEVLKRKREKLAAGRSRTQREAILYLKKDHANPTTILLNYLVDGADWSPQYNLRSNPTAQQVLVEYNAIVHQTSGENWNNVSLSLSTAQPTMAAAAPTLDPMSASLIPQGAQLQQQAISNASFGNNVAQFEDNFRRQRSNFQKGKAAQKLLNTLVASNQALYYNASGVELQQMQEQVAAIARTEGISVTYQLPGELSLPSRSDQQLVAIANIPTKAEFTLIATPLLTDYIYLQAEIANVSDTVLLPGPASMFRNGDFCGKSELSLVTIGEGFTAGFGIDSQIQVAHELKNKKTRIQGGNQIDTYDYQITLANYKDTAVKIQLLDRMPYTKNSSIKIELVKATPELSTDSDYLRSQRNKNILCWDIDLKPNTTGQDVTVVTYSFTMEYDRNMQIQSRTEQQ